MPSKGNQQTLDRLEIPASLPADTGHDLTNTNLQTHLEDPKLTTAWRTVTNPADIEHYLLLRNRLHFGQVQGTPFTIEPLQSHLDWTASLPAADKILQGSHIPSPELSSLCKSVLLECKAVATLDAIPAALETTDFAGKIKKWREATTTSPSGQHLGRYKALFAQGTYAPEPDDNGQGAFEVFEAKQASISALILRLINFCIDSGHTMSFKDSGNYKIHRLCVIHIYEANFNLLLAVIWRELLRAADQAGTINSGQYGGRPGYEASSLALLEELRIDLLYLTRRTLITFDNNAASCYDRIIASLASLINRKYGLHWQVAVVHGRTLQEARYKLRTAVGISERKYSHSTQFPLYGSGQGSGNSPALWLFISATLFDVDKRFAHGATFQDPSGKISVQLKLSGFVDNTNTSLNDWQPQHQAAFPILLTRLTHDAQTWNDLLFISGGKLELSKLPTMDRLLVSPLHQGRYHRPPPTEPLQSSVVPIRTRRHRHPRWILRENKRTTEISRNVQVLHRPVDPDRHRWHSHVVSTMARKPESPQVPVGNWMATYDQRPLIFALDDVFTTNSP